MDIIVRPATGADIASLERKEAGGQGFAELLRGFIEDVNQKQIAADQAITAFLKGEVANVHDVMVALEEARLALEMTVQVRNKLLDAYREIMRMQI